MDWAWARTLIHLVGVFSGISRVLLSGFRRSLRSNAALTAENTTLRLQLANQQARGLKPRLDPAHKLVLAALFRFGQIDPSALVVIKPATVIGWWNKAQRLRWWLKCRPGRPALPIAAIALIKRLARENSVWSAGRIARELLLKTGLQVDEKTVKKYMTALGRRRPRDVSQKWFTFLKNHARGIVATDFATACTIGFKRFYVLFLIEIESRRIVHWNLAQHPTEQWTANQFKELLGPDHSYESVIHDRDSIFSAFVDRMAEASGVESLKTPPQSPRANAFIERFIGTFRRECLGHLVIVKESMPRWAVREFVRYYNAARPHMSLGPGIPRMPPDLVIPFSDQRHKLPAGYRVVSRPQLGGLHHDYRLERAS